MLSNIIQISTFVLDLCHKSTFTCAHIGVNAHLKVMSKCGINPKFYNIPPHPCNLKSLNLKGFFSVFHTMT